MMDHRGEEDPSTLHLLLHSKTLRASVVLGQKNVVRKTILAFSFKVTLTARLLFYAGALPGRNIHEKNRVTLSRMLFPLASTVAVLSHESVRTRERIFF
jgi:hypothetical protein